MKFSTRNIFILIIFSFLIFSGNVSSQRVMPKLNRGVIALNKGGGQVYVSWRLLGNDPADVAFNLYKSTAGGTPVKIAGPISKTTDYTATGVVTTSSNAFFVKPIINGVEQNAGSSYVLPANAPVRHYIAIPQTAEPENDGVNYNTWQTHVGDVDGDGEFEYINVRNYVGAVAPTGRSTKIDCVKLNGTLLWRLDMGVDLGNTMVTVNGSGSLVVADFDGDGKDEVMLRTFEGSCFNYGSADSIRIGDTNKNGTIGSINRDPEFLSVIDGITGKEKDRVLFEPSNGGDGWAKFGANERPAYLYCAIAYLDGVLPSFVSVRGVGQAGLNTYAYTYDYRNGKITKRWNWAPKAGDNVSQAHNILVFDLDNDGKDEICFLGSALDDDGKLMYANQDFWHGDHYRVCDMDPDRPGYEIFSITQGTSSLVGMSVIDGLTGEYLRKWYLSAPGDVDRGDAGDYYAGSKGVECMSTMGGLYDLKGNTVATNRFPTWGIWWDGDMQRELIVGVNSQGTSPAIEKWSTGRLFSIYSDDGQYSNSIPYGGHPQFWGDIMGDWREEMITETNDHKYLRLYSTWDAASSRIYTLMDNPGYKTEVTCKGRIGGAFPDYYLGGDMQTPPPPPIVNAKLHWKGNSANNTWDANITSSWLNNGTSSAFNANDSVLFDLTGTNVAPVSIAGIITPAQVTVHSPIDYSFNGTGSISGSAGLTKVGKGTLTLNNKNNFTGKTTVWDGAVNVNDTLSSAVVVYGGTWGGTLSQGLTGGRIGGHGAYTNVTLEYGGSIVPGQGVGSAETLRIDSLTEKKGAANFIDLSNDPTGLIHKNDLIIVNKNLNIADGITVGINLTDGTLSAGFYPVFKCLGTISGNVSKISFIGLSEYVYTVENRSGIVGIVIPQQRTKSSLVWSGTGSKWDLGISQNWLREGNSDVFVSRDSVTFNDAGSATKLVNLPTDLYADEVVFDGTTNYTLSGTGAICGSGKLIKRGSSTVRINGKHNYTGATIIEAGTLEIGSVNDGGEVSSIGASASKVGNLELNGGSGINLISTSSSTNRPITIKNGECSFGAISGSSLVLIGPISGNGTLVKNGAGRLQLNASNTFSGGVTVNQGELFMLGGFAAGTTVTFKGTSPTMANLIANGANDWNIAVPAGSYGYIAASGRSNFTGSLTGGGTLGVNATYVRDQFSGDWSAFEGTINLTGAGQCRLYNSKGYAKATFNLAAAGNSLFYDVAASTNNGSQTVNLGGLKGVAGTYLYDENWVIGSNNTDCTFNGKIVGAALTKVGTGTFTLTDTCFYTSATNINAGKILLGAKACIKGSVMVNSSATLSGIGTINGPVYVKLGGIIAPGYNAIGKLSIGNSMMMYSGATTEMEFRKSSGIITNDQISTVGKIYLNGNLNIVNSGTDALSAGDSIILFKATTGYSGSFTAISPATPGVGLVWDVSKLNTNGIIKVAEAPSSIKSLADIGISIAPNPVVDNLFIELNDLNPNSFVDLYSINGTHLFKDKVQSRKISIPMHTYNSGIYIIKITNQNEVAVGRIIKQ
jgi:fibronectin-binding autotransporter adhesin